jgi:hypothetical protein
MIDMRICRDVNRALALLYQATLTPHYKEPLFISRRKASCAGGDFIVFLSTSRRILGQSGSVVVQALRYKPEGRGFQNYEVNEFLQFT